MFVVGCPWSVAGFRRRATDDQLRLYQMDTISVTQARKSESIGAHVRLHGWVRTRRDSKGGFSFIELNDGSSQGNLQVVAPGELPNYESVVKHLHTGASVAIEGEVKASPAKGQATEVHASRVERL